MRQKPGPKLLNGQREQLIEWLSADYDTRLILLWAKERQETEGWPAVSNRLVWYYRRSKKWSPEIDALRRKRHERAINAGLALKEERIARLAKHADELEAIKWQPDEKGRLWNEKAWRETLADIAAEMGHRKQTIDVRFLREEAQRIAERLGLNRDDVIAEAERILAEGAGV